jgi:biopolymer transport protein ExbD
MAERESGQDDHFNLLPFIAILLCVLGAELLVTMSMATISLGVGAGEGWVPSHDQAKPGKNPLLIEWDGKVATVQHPGGDERIAVDLAAKTLPPELRRVMDELAAKRETDYALFAVRPSGFESYFRLANLFRERGIDLGDEPVEQGKRVRLMRSPQ